ncbi:FAD-dependent oxidoreductase [bacterium]|nr:FAD-dependent oxidoreductase [bacterium]
MLVIGAGISGLASARALQDQGFSVAILEKSRGLGGRMATRRDENGLWDHGVPWFSNGVRREWDGPLSGLDSS